MKKLNNSLIIVSEFVSRNQNSTGYYWAAIIDKLCDDFIDVKVICSTLPENDIKNIDVQYNEIYSLPYNQKKMVGLLSRFFTEIKLSWKFFVCTKKNINNGNILFTGTNPPIFLLLIYFLKTVKKFKWVVLAHDVFPENLVAANIVRKNNLFYKVTKWAYDKIFSSADSMIVIGRDMKELMEKKINYSLDIHYIPNWASLTDVIPVSRDSSYYINKFGWKNKVIFQFFGNLGRVQDLPTTLSAIEKVKSPEAAFIFAGTGAMSGIVQDFISTHKELSIVYLGSISLDKKNEVLSACDVAIVSLSTGMKGLGVPSKAYFSMAADKPLLVVSDVGSELQRVVTDFGVGWFCCSEKPVDLACLIDDICEMDLHKMKGKIHSVFANNFSDTISLEKISVLFRGL